MSEPDQQSNTTPDNNTKRFPWYGYLIIAIAVYPVFAYALPSVLRDSGDVAHYADLLKKFAPLITIPFLILAANTLYANDEKDGETGDKKSNDS